VQSPGVDLMREESVTVHPSVVVVKTTEPEPGVPTKNKEIGSPAVPSNGLPDT
jgi:hypothetical protein